MDIYTVGQVTRYLKELIEADPFLDNLWIEGEVSNMSRSAAGHIYFTLRDESTQVRCVMFRGQLAASGSLIPANGTAVIVHGRLSVYDVQGAYQLYLDLIQPEGVGALHLQFQQLRARLEREGLFDEARKRPLPRFPRRIGVVTSLGGAVIHDIINVVSRRFPSVELVIAPSAVQGFEAAGEICVAIDALNEFGEIDLLILARGGGSLEDLWPFNDERVARAIYGSRVPVVTGVGHETDFTIADFVADFRAPTPSAAAELVVPNQYEYAAQIQSLVQRSRQAMQSRLFLQRSSLERLLELVERSSPQRLVETNRQRTDDLARQATNHIRHTLDLRREKLRSYTLQLEAFNPLSILARGYSVCVHEETGRVVKSIGQVAENDHLQIRIQDGNLRGKVIAP